MTCKYEGDIATTPRKVYRPDGQGKLTCYEEDGVTDSWTYEGAFVDGQMTGQGTTTTRDTPDDPGYIYEGAHDKGWADGYGIWRRRSDNTMMYEGNSRSGKYDGQGTSYRPDGTKEYEGEWRSNNYHGQGTSFRPDGTKGYEGQWGESYWRGIGTLYRPDGSISRNGTWVNGYAAEYEWQEGEEMYWYEGDSDKKEWMHGWGILYRPDRTTVEREGWWQNGEPVDGPPAGHPDAP